jgi:hypothetical protein
METLETNCFGSCYTFPRRLARVWSQRPQEASLQGKQRKPSQGIGGPQRWGKGVMTHPVGLVVGNASPKLKYHRFHHGD